ncbi:MAG TPA: DUF4097 family beta strand repeat-containing protein [Bacilli bacterium]|nr:DUF4097 family beta strand repeat-containing protein [Bacilli bacterium]
MSLARNIGLTGVLVVGLGAVAVLGGSSVFANMADYEDTKTFDAAGVKRLAIEVSSTDVHLVKATDGKISAHFYGKGKEDFYQLIAEQSGDEVRVRIDRPKMQWFGGWGTTSLNLDIALPEQEYDQLTLNASSGDVDLGSLVAGDVKVDLSSGSLQLADWKGDTMSVESSSGEIVLHHLTASDAIDVKASSGHIKLDGVKTKHLQAGASSGSVELSGVEAEEFDAETSSGDIHFDATSTMPKRIAVDASSGEVELRLPQTAAFDFDIDVSSGDVNLDFPNVTYTKTEDHHKQGKVGDGGAAVKVETSSGDVRISRK